MLRLAHREGQKIKRQGVYDPFRLLRALCLFFFCSFLPTSLFAQNKVQNPKALQKKNQITSPIPQARSAQTTSKITTNVSGKTPNVSAVKPVEKPGEKPPKKTDLGPEGAGNDSKQAGSTLQNTTADPPPEKETKGQNDIGLTAPAAFLQTEADRAEGELIIRSEVVGNQRVSEEDVLNYVKQKEGQKFKKETLASDVKALWDSGFFENIDVDLSRQARGVSLRYIVLERPNIKAIVFEGNDELDADKLKEIVDIKENSILSIPAVRRGELRIKEAYGEKGYLLAEVDFKLEPEKNNEVSVKYTIREHQSVTIRRITFIGNIHLDDERLKEVMQSAQTSLFSFGAGGPYKQEALERDVLMLSALYYDEGYMNVQIGTPRVMLTPDREGIEITININEGPRFRIRQIRVYERNDEGKEVEPLGGKLALREKVQVKSGDFFNRAAFVSDLQAVRTMYRDAGYANVIVDTDTSLDPEKHLVDVAIPIQRGERVRVERIEIRGNTKTRDSVIRREMELQEHDYFSETKAEDSKRRIQALGYFERVDMSTSQGSTSDAIVITFEVGEKSTGTFQIGAGFSSVENFILTAQIQQANLFGNGQSLSVQGQLSSLRQLLTIRFFEPYFFGSDWSMSAEGYNQLYVYTDFSRRTLGASLTFGYALIQPWLRLSLTATAQYDSIDTTSSGTFFGSAPSFYVSAYTRLPLANLFNAGRTFSLRPSLTYDSRDNRLFATSGIFLTASTEFANQILGSEVEFFRHRLNARFYVSLGGQTTQPGSGFVFKVNSELGYITSPNSNGVPIFARYFLGGILDVRGYRLRTLGSYLPLNQSLDPNAAPATNQQGFPGANIGGNLQAYTNFELEFPVLDKVGIRGVAFFDVGNSWNTESQYCDTTPAPQLPGPVKPCFSPSSSLGYLRASVGFGVRWFSPLGPLRFEWGFPITRYYREETSVFEFTIGQFF